jgi:hypothetical protein
MLFNEVLKSTSEQSTPLKGVTCLREYFSLNHWYDLFKILHTYLNS